MNEQEYDRLRGLEVEEVDQFLRNRIIYNVPGHAIREAEDALVALYNLYITMHTTLSNAFGSAISERDDAEWERDMAKRQLAVAERSRDNAEAKYDGACLMMHNASGPDGWEVTVIDGETSITPIDWRARCIAAQHDAAIAEDRVASFQQFLTNDLLTILRKMNDGEYA